MAHSYDKRFNVIRHGSHSYYTDDVAEVLAMIESGELYIELAGQPRHPSAIAEGYADYIYHDDVTEIIRRTDRSYTQAEFVEAFAKEGV